MQLTATAREGFAFVNWTDLWKKSEVKRIYSFEVTKDAELTANFKAVVKGNLHIEGSSECRRNGNRECSVSAGFL